MKITKLAKIKSGQDGAIWNNILFRFATRGQCSVYSLPSVLSACGEEVSPICEFTLGRAETLAPHSNSVSFGCDYYYEGDEFPLLYTNIYNNYAKSENPMHGVTLVYRIFRTEKGFSSSLVQKIKVGFTSDLAWRSAEADARPYGNFVIDREKGVYYAFTMRDESQTTEFFAFPLPSGKSGIENEGIREVTLEKEQMLFSFSTPYSRYLQGGCYHGDKIYSTEGFTHDEQNPPAIRVISLDKKEQESYINLVALGKDIEPELIEFSEDECYYSDCSGNFFRLEF